MFYIVDAWEDHNGPKRVYAVSSKGLAVKKAEELRVTNKHDTIQVRGPFSVDDGRDFFEDWRDVVYEK